MPKTRTKSLLRSLLAIGAAGAIAALRHLLGVLVEHGEPGQQDRHRHRRRSADNDSDSALYSRHRRRGRHHGRPLHHRRPTPATSTPTSSSTCPTPSARSAQYVDMTVTAGTDARRSSATAPASSPTARRSSTTGTLQDFRTAHSSWANGLAYNPGGDTKWEQGDAVTFRVQLTVQDDNNAQGKVTGDHRLMWEARNQ